MRIFLNLKHWQLFILIFICGSWVSPSPYKEIINSIALITFLGWIFSISKYGQEKIQIENLPNVENKLFNINLVLVPTILIISQIIKSILRLEEQHEFTPIDLIFIFLSIYVLYSIITSLIYISKIISILELKREVKLSDYIGNFFLIIFFFVGIWILQPKIKKFNL